MARRVYYVVLHDGAWKVKHDDRHIGVYLTQKAAIRGAVDLAHKDGSGGHDAQVLVQGSDHKFRTEWTYGHDP